MNHFKLFLFFILSVGFLNAQISKKVVYVEDLSSSKKLLKDEFTNEDTKLYTIVVGKLQEKHDPIEFFRRFSLTNALAFRYGENKEFMRVLSGVYPSHVEAKEAIKQLPKEVLKFEPYHSRISRQQKIYKKFNETVINKTTIKNNSSSIFISGTNESKKLKEQFLSKSPKLYSVSLASFDFKNKKQVLSFLKKHNIEKKALAHLYGKDKKGVRVVYGLYNSYSDAKEDIKNLNKSLRQNSPFVQKVQTMQNFYKKFNNIEDEKIVQLQIKKKTTEEKKMLIKKAKNDNIKVLKKVEPQVIVKQRVITKKNIKPKVKKEEKKHISKKKPEKKEKEYKYLKESKFNDVYYVEENDDFNILNEVFLNENSSFYTLDLGTLEIKKISLDKFFIEHNLEKNSLAYKYGDQKEFAKVIYGAFETRDDASEELKKLNISDSAKVSNIQEHQKIYKKYHENIIKENLPVRKESEKRYTNDFMYVNLENKLKEAFINRQENIYTITLITFHKNDINVKEFLEKNNLDKDVVVYSLGSQNNYYRIFYGAFDSSKETLKVIDSLPYDLKKNQPYVSKVSTNSRRFESYNNRKLDNAVKNARMLEIK